MREKRCKDAALRAERPREERDGEERGARGPRGPQRRGAARHGAHVVQGVQQPHRVHEMGVSGLCCGERALERERGRDSQVQCGIEKEGMRWEGWEGITKTSR